MSFKCHSFANDALGSSDAIGLVQRLKKKDLSPLELRATVVSRAQQVNGTLNAIASDCFAQKPALQASDKHLFSCLPTFVKDNLPVKGFHTGFGSAAVTPKREKRHDPYARQFIKMGFDVVGKSALPEFGFNATTEPEHQSATLNPWNTEHSCGASSGGAAALVAAGVVPLAHGNDGGGSIRIPAACCGLVGLKPSRGRHVNSLAARSLPVNIVSEGVLTRSVRDTAFFHYEAEKFYRNKKLPKLPLVTEPGAERLRIGLVMDTLTGTPLDEDVSESLFETARQLQAMGHQVEEIPFPVDLSFADDFALYWSMMVFLVKHSGKLAIGEKFAPEKMDGLSHGLAAHYQKQLYKTPLMLLRLKRHGQRILKRFAKNKVDIILSPTLGHAAPPLGYLSPEVPFDLLFERLRAYVGFTPLANVSGAPAISLPLAMSRENLPIGMHFMANMGREDQLLALAFELEEACKWKHLDQAGQ